jgi:hypothetical protein
MTSPCAAEFANRTEKAEVPERAAERQEEAAKRQRQLGIRYGKVRMGRA